MTVGHVGRMLGITAEGARYRCNKLTERGWLEKSTSYRTYYVPVKSIEMRTKIMRTINEFEERELR